MSLPQGRLMCECGRTYANRDNLQSHKNRHCRLRRLDVREVQNEGVCTVCGSEFRSYSGMRQHMRLRHPVEYNNALQREGRNSRQLWTEDEENALAKAEAEYEGENLIEFLASQSNRTKEAIKARRRNQRYVEKVARFKVEFQQLRDVDEGNSHDIEGNEIDNNDILMRDGELIEAISNIPTSKLDGLDIEFRNFLRSNPKEDVVPVFESWCASIIAKYRRISTNQQRAQQSTTNSNQNLNKRQKRAQDYKYAQKSFKTNKKDYARKLIDGISTTNKDVIPDIQEVKSYYQNVFETPSIEDKEYIRDKQENETVISYPITEEELEEAIKTSRVNTPGPDGITLYQVRCMPRGRMMLLLNSILYLEYIPGTLKESRTTLIPKSNTNLHDVKSWRPITISSILLRLLNKILARRMGGIELCNNQRGFTSIDGCFANFATIETIITEYRKETKPLSIISLDVAKAFDTISHDSIRRALKRLNIDLKTRLLIEDNYRNSKTTITINKQEVGTFEVKRGVKQGDPMSPFLFNAVVDEVMMQLNNSYSGIKVGTAKLTSLAYADDIIIFANTPEDAQRMLNHSLEFFGRRGLQVNPTKCKSIILKCVPGKKKLYAVTEPVFQVNEENIPSLNIGEVFRYLGHYFNTEGISPCTNSDLVEQLSRIQRAPLKPQQKFIIIRDHLLPRYIATLQRPNVAKKVLQKTDRIIRSALKKALHLPLHCPNSLFYTPTKLGGLGIFNFTLMIPIITVSRWEKLKDLSELLGETYNKSEPWVNRYRKMLNDNFRTKEDVQKHHEQQLQKSISGNGLHQVKHHSACNSYIRKPPSYWNGEDFIRAIQLRFNLLPCLGTPSNRQSYNEKRCRAGCVGTESLSHILQKCPLTHRWRILRHNYVVHKVARFARKKGWEVQIEPRIRCKDNTLKKPDLILVKDEKVIVCDVGINWEGPTTLAEQYEMKQAIYSGPPFVEKVKEMNKDKQLYILPLIAGARGAWCQQNNNIVHHLDLTSRDIQDIITTTIRGGWTIHREFMKQVWRERSRRRHT